MRGVFGVLGRTGSHGGIRRYGERVCTFVAGVATNGLGCLYECTRRRNLDRVEHYQRSVEQAQVGTCNTFPAHDDHHSFSVSKLTSFEANLRSISPRLAVTS